MKITKIIDQAEEYLNTEHRKRKSKIKCLKYVLKKLRKREKKLESRLAAGKGNEEKISNELAIIHAQRKKGIELIQQLDEEPEAKVSRKKAPKGEADISSADREK